MEVVVQVVAASLSSMKWRLRPSSKRRLQTDILALCSRMRGVIMLDYGGKMPELKDQLCALIRLCHKESSIFKHLRVMVIDDMIYLIHVEGLAELVKSTLNSEVELHFVDIEQDPPKMITKAENSSIGKELIAVQELFALAFPNDAADRDYLQCQTTDTLTTSESSTNTSEFIDLSSCMQDTLVTVPTLNGWLLGYPVVYLFSRERISDAIYNLSTQSLHIYRILVTRNETSMKESRQEELMSFSVPYDLSVEGSEEAWATTFMAAMQAKLEESRQFWGSMKLENLKSTSKRAMKENGFC
ncbi:putative Calmodulin [Heracleum sosnowskyi]|uniref:Calmodulin n=1 Tax=Heracleum sosnowskyi TaxID=360622 RepID=A0AAD8I5R1_9APIA|nr:putative Calmodulin [Heracleum sosnowskyi]